MRHAVMDWILAHIYPLRDRSEELRRSTPDNVKKASTDLYDATMNARGSMTHVRKEADVLKALVQKMQGQRH